jgi:hypothetical protein
MKISLVGRVRNTKLPAWRPLLPLFEAVINSLQAIELGKVARGKIEIEVDRAQTEFELGGELHAPALNFAVTDNGPGFDEENFRSFETSDSILKERLGGKGVGRLLWLKAFDDVSVDSIFRDPHGRVCRRRFRSG